MPIGNRGEVRFALASPLPLRQVQVRLGPQVVGEVSAPDVDLRDMRALGFAVPRTPGIYNLTVEAMDSAGCENATTLTRQLTVQ